MDITATMNPHSRNDDGVPGFFYLAQKKLETLNEIVLP